MFIGILKDFASEIKRVNDPFFYDSVFVQKIDEYLIRSQEDERYSGIRDNEQNNVYIRLINSPEPQSITFTDPPNGKNFNSCSFLALNPATVVSRIRIIITAFRIDPDSLLKGFIDSLTRVDFKTLGTRDKEAGYPFTVTFRIDTIYPFSNTVASMELGEKTSWKEEMIIVAIDGELNYIPEFKFCEPLCDLQFCEPSSLSPTGLRNEATVLFDIASLVSQPTNVINNALIELLDLQTDDFCFTVTPSSYTYSSSLDLNTQLNEFASQINRQSSQNVTAEVAQFNQLRLIFTGFDRMTCCGANLNWRLTDLDTNTVYNRTSLVNC